MMKFLRYFIICFLLLFVLSIFNYQTKEAYAFLGSGWTSIWEWVSGEDKTLQPKEDGSTVRLTDSDGDEIIKLDGKTGAVSTGTVNSAVSTTSSYGELNFQNDAGETITSNKGAFFESDTNGAEEISNRECSWINGVEYCIRHFCGTVELADSDKLILQTSGFGYGTIKAEGEHHAEFAFDTDGTTYVTHTGSYGTAEDTDTVFNIYDAGSTIGFNNELGASKIVSFEFTITSR